MSQANAFKFTVALMKDVREHCHLATWHQSFPPVSVGILNISAWIHLWLWLTRSGPSGLNWDWLVDDKTLSLAPLMGVELQWGPSLWSGCGV